MDNKVTLLKDGKVLLAPSDTVLGLLGKCTQSVFNRFNDIKSRNNKPYLLLAPSIEAIEQYVDIADSMKKSLNSFWPGPLTVILKQSLIHQVL